MKHIASFILLAALVAAVPVPASAMQVEWYEAQTQLETRWSHGRDDVVTLIRKAQTNDDTGEVNETAIGHSIVEIGKYVAAVRCKMRGLNEFCRTRME